MMTTTNDSTEIDRQLNESWGDFCDQLKSAGELVFRPTAPSKPIDRAKGFRLLARNISLALQFQLENNDPLLPELMHYFDPIRKQGGDNTDALYVGAPINGVDTYRISGHRGSAPYFAITVLEDGHTPWGGAVVGSLLGEQIKSDSDGSFEVILSPHQQSGNWIKTSAGSWRVTIRQFFSDWENELPMTARIDRVAPIMSEPELTPQRLIEGLQDAVQWLRESTHYWADMLDRWQLQPNNFLSYRQLDDNAIDATPGGEPLICYWRVPRDEALIIRVRPPQADYWNVEFGNYWWETMDYRYRHCSVNSYHSVLQDDGELIVVVSHDDPGVANWLDPSGHEEGYVTVRWIGCTEYPVPQCQQLARTELMAALPATIKLVTPELRQRQLQAKRRGIAQRFRT